MHPLSPLGMHWSAPSLQCKLWIAQLFPCSDKGLSLLESLNIIYRLPCRILHSGPSNPETWLQILSLETWGQGSLVEECCEGFWKQSYSWYFLLCEYEGLEWSVHTGTNLRKANRWSTYTLRPVLPCASPAQAAGCIHTHARTHTDSDSELVRFSYSSGSAVVLSKVV